MSKILRRTFGFKAIGTDSDKPGVIKGYASTFDNVDQGMDRIEKGAFKRTLKSKKAFPILANHDTNQPIGWSVEQEEDDKGLHVVGELNIENPLGKMWFDQAKKAIELGADMGISIGYGVIKAVQDEKFPGVRVLKELKLYEWSLVVFPMNESAYVTDAKAMNEYDLEILVKNFLEHAAQRGYSREEVESALRPGGPASKLIDPAIGHSIDALIAKFKNT